jgi:chromosomal replication initiation ATPase DnaA
MITQNLRNTRASLLTQKKVTIVEDIYADVISSVAREFGYPVSKITCKRRIFELVMARNMACYILHTTFKQKASQIAPFFHRDRTTILHAVNNFPKDIKQVPFIKEKYDYVMMRIEHLHSTIYALQ